MNHKASARVFAHSGLQMMRTMPGSLGQHWFVNNLTLCPSALDLYVIHVLCYDHEVPAPCEILTSLEMEELQKMEAEQEMKAQQALNLEQALNAEQALNVDKKAAGASSGVKAP